MVCDIGDEVNTPQVMSAAARHQRSHSTPSAACRGPLVRQARGVKNRVLQKAIWAVKNRLETFIHLLSAKASVVNVWTPTSPAQYGKGHKAYAYEQTSGGAISAAATTALNPNVLQASDGRHCRRDTPGAWTHGGDAVIAHRALAATRRHRLRSLLLASAGAARSRRSTINHCRTLDCLRRRNASSIFLVQK